MSNKSKKHFWTELLKLRNQIGKFFSRTSNPFGINRQPLSAWESEKERSNKKALSAFIFENELSCLFGKSDIKVVDIGARGGALSKFNKLSKFIHYFAFEPDFSEAETLINKIELQSSWREITIIPNAIFMKKGESLLYCTKDPGWSSFFKIDQVAAKKFFNGDDFEIVENRLVPTIPLDHAADTYGFKNACFLKIDTQGSELEVLKSGEKLINDSILGIYIETEFQPFYENQPLFADIDSYLRCKGFTLFDLDRALLRRSSYRKDFYSRKQVTWAHALYLKEPDQILLNTSDNNFQKVVRLLALAIVFEHYDFAMEILTSDLTSKFFLNIEIEKIKHNLEIIIHNRTREIQSKVKSPRLLRDPLSGSYRDRKYLF